MYPRDTIAAIATAPGAGGISIVRISGPDSRKIARQIFRGLPGQDSESHRLYVGRILSAEGGTIDRGMCVLMLSPRSYTGEDVAELHCHGGALVSRTVLAAALAAGARLARHGEFTLRAFLNGKLDLAQAESIVDLVSARTPAALRVARAQLEGTLSQAVESLRQRLVGIAARLEVNLDFSEEEVGEIDRASLRNEIVEVAANIREIAVTFERGRVLREGFRVAIVGKPNVGKSSLLNSLLKSDRAIVTAVPGTTRDVLEETVDLGGCPVVLIDTAGMRKSTDEIERIGIERTYREIANADAVVMMLDGSQPWDEEDEQVFAATRQIERILLINKADLRRRLMPEKILEHAGKATLLEASAKTGMGIDLLRERLTSLLGAERTDAGHVVVTRERHRQALDAAAVSLAAAAESLGVGHPPEVISVDVSAALDDLSEIAGRTSPEAVLDRIFSEFCIGK